MTTPLSDKTEYDSYGFRVLLGKNVSQSINEFLKDLKDKSYGDSKGRLVVSLADLDELGGDKII